MVPVYAGIKRSGLRTGRIDLNMSLDFFRDRGRIAVQKACDLYKRESVFQCSLDLYAIIECQMFVFHLCFLSAVTSLAEAKILYTNRLLLVPVAMTGRSGDCQLIAFALMLAA